MSFCTAGVRFAQRTARHLEIPVAVLPAFLCPGFLKPVPLRKQSRCSPTRHLYATEALQEESGARPTTFDDSRPSSATLAPVSGAKLPVQCPGCGALSQATQPDEPGFYTLTRKSMRGLFQGLRSTKSTRDKEIVEKSLTALEESGEAIGEHKGIIEHLSAAFTASSVNSTPNERPICDRCHNLKHHETGVSIHHPSVQSIQDTIFESPHKYNHIYHVIDAADFPMSLIPGLHKLLHLTPQRSHNRRSQTSKYFHGRKTEISFIITRSDLLGPTKEHIDRLMPYLRDVLRDALGRAAQGARLGNLRCVSAKRQWWTKELKEEIWNRGGGGWMVGKVNVGKSQLFHEVFPKGRMESWGKHTTISTRKDSAQGTEKEIPTRPVTHEEMVVSTSQALESGGNNAMESENGVFSQEPAVEQNFEHSTPQEAQAREAKALQFQVPESTTQFNNLEPLDTSSLLPPLPIETEYPAMPLVSSLPGTTASPIRIPFGNGKGELIDLPGLSRSDLELYVKPEQRTALVMRSRSHDSQQRVLRPGQAILIGGIVRITPTTPDLHILYHNFTPLPVHQTSSEKAEGIQSGTRETNVENLAVKGTENKICTAGKFHLKWDVTKYRTGPITRHDAAGIKVERLPFRVLGLDILIEGVGWVELAAQIRKPYGFLDKKGPEELETEEIHEIDPSWPEIEVFSPEGRFVGHRRPMNASLMNGDKPGSKNLKARPRKAMKGVKKMEKKRAREAKVL